MPDDAPSTEDRLLSLLNRLRMLGPGHPLDGEDVPVTPSQLVLLDWIAASPGCGVQEIAAGLGLTPPTVSVGVRRLEQAGLLQREPNPQDRRSIRLFLTPQGENLHRRAQEFRRDRARRLLSGLTEEEQETLLRLWEKALNATDTPS